MTQSPATPLPSPKRRRRLREAAGLTQAQIAARMGVSRETVRAWESGRSAPRGRKREAYAKLLAEQEAGCAPESVADDTGERVQRSQLVLVPAGTDGDALVSADTDGAGSVGPTSSPAGQDACADGRGPEGKGPDGDEPDGRDRDGEDRTDGHDDTDGGDRDDQDIDGPVSGGKDGSDGDTGEGDPDDPAGVPVEGEGDSGGASEPPSHQRPLTPTQAFDALYEFCAPALVRQTYLLTGRRELARESVERAFQVAWQRWPEVAVDRDPAGWVRATAYEYALSPWHRLRLRHRHPEAPPADPADRALLAAVLRLPPVYRRTLLLYDGVGLDLPETAAETEASTPATANRLLHAREAMATYLPELSAPEELHRRLAALAGSERLRAAKPVAVRTGSERRARSWTRAAIAVTTLLVTTTTLTLATAPDHYEPPLSPGETVRGVPPRAAPGTLSQEELDLRTKLRSETENGPGRLVPQGR
ncbi:helix-turn-helix domain-containing protein [Streptomyces sp. NPDC086783]|uniref:helix-turn-helix domain-containing protein n=1 Tax=Streptomyces sp. NPDC086783 TaxID=3365758 RepID=UPI00382033CB